MGAAERVHVLTFLEGRGVEGAFALQPDASYIVGRSAEADLTLEDDTVSRKHARFFFARDSVWLRDLGSRNGTRVNGRQVDRCRLRAGDRITIGANLLRVDAMSADELHRLPRREDSTGRSMMGSIDDIPLADVLQWLATSRKTGVLRIQGARDGELHLREGRVYFARIEGGQAIHPERALLRMLAWTHGTFALDTSAATEEVEDEIAPSLEQVLMEAARLQDELARLAESTSLPEHTLTLVLPATTPWRELEGAELDLIQAVAEGRSWPEILDASSMNDLAQTELAIRLRDRGFVEFD